MSIPKRTPPKTLPLATGLSLLLAVGPAYAAGQSGNSGDQIGALLAMSLEELVNLEVSIASGSAKPIRRAPSVASVITAADIEATGATTLDEALETVPGLHVAPSNFNRMNSVYSIRGIHTQENPQVLMLIDGSPNTNGNKGNRTSTFSLPVADISRIEVIRGPGSALHGADAFAGVINVITKDAAEIGGVRAGQRAGSFGATDSWLQYGGNLQGWNLAMSAEFMRSDGDTDRIVDSDLQTRLDAALRTSASLAPGPLETDDSILNLHMNLQKDNWTLRLWNWSQDDGGEGPGVGQMLDPVGNENVDIFMGDLLYHNKTLAPGWDASVRLSHLYNKVNNYIRVFPPGARLPIGRDGNVDFAPSNFAGFTTFPDGVIGYPGAKENHESVNADVAYSGFNSHVVRVGTGYRYIDYEARESKNFGPGVLDGARFHRVQDGTLTDVTGTPYIFVKDTSREIGHILLQDEWALAKGWELTAGVRFDNYSDFGGTTNPRLALVWETTPQLTTKLLYGSAFRPPSFAESYYINNPLALGNPNLDPETIDTLELAFEYQPVQKLRTRFNLFTYSIEGLIEYRLDPGQTTKTAQNAKDQEGHGVEVEAIWDATGSLRLQSNFAYQRSRDKETEAIVPDAPEMQFYANAHWIFLPKWSLDGQYFWVGPRHRATGDTRDDVKNNDIVNLTLRRKEIAKNWDAAIAVRNLLDEDVREPSQPSIPNDYPMEGRSLWAEVRVHF